MCMCTARILAPWRSPRTIPSTHFFDSLLHRITTPTTWRRGAEHLSSLLSTSQPCRHRETKFTAASAEPQRLIQATGRCFVLDYTAAFLSFCSPAYLRLDRTPDWPRKKWLTDIILLTSAHVTREQTEELDEYYRARPRARPFVEYAPSLGPAAPPDSPQRCVRLEATHKDYGLFTLPSGEEVVPLYVEYRPLRQAERGSPLYLPVHRACLTVADRYIESAALAPAPMPDSITSTRQLWKVLYRRMPGSVGGCVWELPEPHDYFGGALCRNVDWEAGDDPAAAMVS